MLGSKIAAARLIFNKWLLIYNLALLGHKLCPCGPEPRAWALFASSVDRTETTHRVCPGPTLVGPDAGNGALSIVVYV